MMTMMILPIAEAQIVAAQTVAAPEMTPGGDTADSGDGEDIGWTDEVL